MSPRTILVTGASSGIGAAVTRQLLGAGHHVVGVARRATELQFDGPEAGCYHAAAMDLSELEALPRRLSALAQQVDELEAAGMPGLDGAVLAAGAGRFGSLEELSYAQIRSLIELDLVAPIFVARWLLPRLKRGAGGDLVLIGSEAGQSGGRRGAVYAAAKSGLAGLARALRQEGARSTVRVCLINPGMVATPFFDDQPFAPGEAEDEHLVAEDVAAAVRLALEARAGAAIDEINLTPQKFVLRFPKKPPNR